MFSRISSSNDTHHIIIKSPDTDVFIVALHFSRSMKSPVLFHTGRGKHLRTINISQVSEGLGADRTEVLIGLHCLTGCDSTSGFRGKGKATPAKMALTEAIKYPVLRRIGDEFTVTTEIIAGVEEFVCHLYKQMDCSDVNTARYNLFQMGTVMESSMPPNKDALCLHVKRANYQAAIYKRALDPHPVVLSPHGHGWKINGDDISIHWMDLPPAPNSVMEFAHCSCKKSQCAKGKCSCLEKKMPCTDLCKCSNCANMQSEEQCIPESDDSDVDEYP